MKKTAIILIVLSFIACKKKIVEPYKSNISAPIQTVKNYSDLSTTLSMYYGNQILDTSKCNLTINGVSQPFLNSVNSATTNNNLNPGDVLQYNIVLKPYYGNPILADSFYITTTGTYIYKGLQYICFTQKRQSEFGSLSIKYTVPAIDSFYIQVGTNIQKINP